MKLICLSLVANFIGVQKMSRCSFHYCWICTYLCGNGMV